MYDYQKNSSKSNYYELKNNIDTSGVGVAAEPDPQMLKTYGTLAVSDLHFTTSNNILNEKDHRRESPTNLVVTKQKQSVHVPAGIPFLSIGHSNTSRHTRELYIRNAKEMNPMTQRQYSWSLATWLPQSVRLQCGSAAPRLCSILANATTQAHCHYHSEHSPWDHHH